MNQNYLGRLSEHDPLHGYLLHDIRAQISAATDHSTYRVFRLNGSNDVYLYEDRNSGAKVIGKFFLSTRKKDAVKADSRLMRDYGLTGYPHHVVRPLGQITFHFLRQLSATASCVLYRTYCNNQQADTAI